MGDASKEQLFYSMFTEVSDQNTTKSLIPWVRKPLKDTTNLKAIVKYLRYTIKPRNRQLSPYRKQAVFRFKHSKDLPAITETWVQSLGWEDPLEKEMETHSSIVAWEISLTQESGGLQFMRSQRIGDDRVVNQHHQP